MIVRMFMPQFWDLVRSGEKKQTVRPTPKRQIPAGEEISLRGWSDKPYRSKQIVLAESTVKEVLPVTIDCEGVLLDNTRVNREWFSYQDGFRDQDTGGIVISRWLVMMDWFSRRHGLPFTGVTIYWN